eukprot:354080-Chlamydomonas_euryale.AAC.2
MCAHACIPVVCSMQSALAPTKLSPPLSPLLLLQLYHVPEAGTNHMHQIGIARAAAPPWRRAARAQGRGPGAAFEGGSGRVWAQSPRSLTKPSALSESLLRQRPCRQVHPRARPATRPPVFRTFSVFRRAVPPTSPAPMIASARLVCRFMLEQEAERAAEPPPSPPNSRRGAPPLRRGFRHWLRLRITACCFGSGRGARLRSVGKWKGRHACQAAEYGRSKRAARCPCNSPPVSHRAARSTPCGFRPLPAGHTKLSSALRPLRSQVIAASRLCP